MSELLLSSAEVVAGTLAGDNAHARLHMRGAAVVDTKLAPQMIVREYGPIDATEAETAIIALRAVASYIVPWYDGAATAAGITWLNSDVSKVVYPGNKRWVLIRQTLHSTYALSGDPNDDIYTRQVKAQVGRSDQVYVRYWPHVTEAQKDTLIAGVAAADFTIGGTAYTHDTYSIEERPNKGLKDVVQVGRVPVSGGGTGTYDYYDQFFAVGKDGTIYRVTEGRKYGQSLAAARTYANWDASNPPIPGNRPTGIDNLPLVPTGRVVAQGSRYIGIKQVWEVGETDYSDVSDGDW